MALHMVVVLGRTYRWSGFAHGCCIRPYLSVVWLYTWLLYQAVFIGGLALHMVVALGRTYQWSGFTHGCCIWPYLSMVWLYTWLLY